MRRYQAYPKCGSHAVHATYSSTEGKRDSTRFDSLVFCMRCRRNIGIHQWCKLLRNACTFFLSLLSLAYLHLRRVSLYCCTSVAAD